jgi:hypothetical protein
VQEWGKGFVDNPGNVLPPMWEGSRRWRGCQVSLQVSMEVLSRAWHGCVFVTERSWGPIQGEGRLPPTEEGGGLMGGCGKELWGKERMN